jgi:hypothetical protein
MPSSSFANSQVIFGHFHRNLATAHAPLSEPIFFARPLHGTNIDVAPPSLCKAIGDILFLRAEE